MDDVDSNRTFLPLRPALDTPDDEGGVDARVSRAPSTPAKNDSLGGGGSCSARGDADPTPAGAESRAGLAVNGGLVETDFLSPQPMAVPVTDAEAPTAADVAG